MNSITDDRHETQALVELSHHPQWVCYIFQKRSGGKDTKPPINPHIAANRPLRERLADPTNPDTWASYEEATARWKASPAYKGIGFVFTESDPYAGVDLDDCRDTTTGKIEAWAQQIIALLNSYTEISAKGTGIHIILRGNLLTVIEQLGRAQIQHKNKAGNIEIYDRLRYFTYTGKHLLGTPETIHERQNELAELYCATFPDEEESTSAKKDEHKEKRGEARGGLRRPPQQPAPGVSAIRDIPDDVLIERAMNARTTGTQFTQLWQGDDTSYIDPKTRRVDESRADLALCGLLAYWTGKDAARMDALFQQSGLYRNRPERWTMNARSGETYGQGTIREAIAHQRQVYDPSWKPGRQQSLPRGKASIQKRAFLDTISLRDGDDGRATV